MLINKTQKRMVAGGIILATAALLTFPLFRSSAQKNRKDTTVTKDDDSTRTKRKPHTLDGHKRTFKIENGDLEKSMKELECSMEDLNKINLDNIGETVESAMKSIDMDKIQETVESAMKSIDFAKIQETVQSALQSVDLDKMKIQVQAGMKDVDWKKVQKEIDDAMKEAKVAMEEAKKINMEDVKKEMEQAKEEMKKAKIDMEQAKVEMKEGMKNAKVEMREGMEKAKVEITKAKEKLGLMKEMFTEMEKDGLIKKGEKFNIDWRDGKLYINEKEQPQSVTDKYKKYMDLDIHLNNAGNDDNDL